MQNKYCLPIIKSAKDEVLAEIDSSEADYGFFEVWVDYIQDFDISFLTGLVDKLPGRIVVVFRRQDLGTMLLDFEEHAKIIDALSDKDCLIDLDITCQKEDLEHVKGKSIKTIVSFHDYQKTPDNDGLRAKLQEIESYSPYIVKLSTFCASKKDALRLLNLQQELAEAGKKHIVLGMGQNGQITRVFATLWGNELAFAPKSPDESSAAGQLTREQLAKIFEEIK